MLSQNYRVPTTTPQWRIALMVSVIVAAMVLASAASPKVEGPRGPNPGRLSAIQTVATYCTTNENGEINWDQKFDSSGDLEIGTRLAGPDFSSISILGDISGKARVRVNVDAEGRIIAVELLAGIEPVIDQALLEVVRATAFAPWTHKAYGPVGVELIFVIEIEPPSRPMRERASQGREVVELVRAFQPGEGRQTRGLDIEGLPRYLTILDRGPFPTHIAPPVEADYSFQLLIDPTGAVERAEAVGRPQAVMREPELLSAAEKWTAELSEWLRTFRFDPLVHPEIGPVSGFAMVDLRATKDGVHIATYAPPTVDWREKLSSIYRLEKDQALKLIPAPFPDGRLDLFRSIDPGGARRHPEGPSGIRLNWSEAGLEQKSQAACYGQCWLFARRPKGHGFVLGDLSQQYGMRVDLGPGLSKLTLGPGDVVMRSGATLQELLDSFSAELGRLLDIEVS